MSVAAQADLEQQQHAHAAAVPPHIAYLSQPVQQQTAFTSRVQDGRPVYGGPHERRLLTDLLQNYQILERPVANESDPLIVSFGLTLQQIIDVDEKNQQIISNIWLRLEWVDTNLRWKPSDYGGIEDLRISPDKVWRPDILMYNSADEKFDATYHSNVVVQYNGSCLYIPPGIFKSTCKIDITWFPFDDQFCNLKFGSWSYHGFALDLRLSSEEGDVSTYIPNGEWVLMGVPGKRNQEKYDCCMEPFIDITFTIGLRRRTLYYGFNLIVPAVIISSMTLLSFTLPPDSGEKLTLGVTILLSMIVFLMQLAEIMPATSDSVSIVGSYFACIMVMVAFSVVMTVVVLNFHHRTTEQQQEMPRWIRTVILTWLPFILRIKKTPELFRSSANFERNKNEAAAAAALNVLSDMKSGIGGGAPITPPHLRRPNCLANDDNEDQYGGWEIPGDRQPGLGPVPVSPTYNSSPSSPTHQELFMLTQKMHEYELLCHKRGCPYIASQQSRFPMTNHTTSREAGYHQMHNGGYDIDPELFANHMPNQRNNNVPPPQPQSTCPYSFSTFPPPPPHTHQTHYSDQHHQFDRSNLEPQSYHELQSDGRPNGANGANGANQGPRASYLFTLMQEEASMHFARSQRLGTGNGDEPPLQENNPCCCCCCTGGQTSGPDAGSSSHEYFGLIMQEFRFITNRLRREDDLNDIIAEWKFAAIVIDRLCLIMFSTFAVISTAVCLLSAPHLIA